MSGFYGGDTEQMRGQSTACTGGAQRLAELISLLSSTVDGVEWVGPDAESFRASWHAEAEGRAREAGETLRRLARELEDHADEQDRASAGDGGGLLDILRDLLPGPFPFPGPIMPLPLPIPGLPLGPDVVDRLGDAVGDWFSGGGATGPQEFYGGDGYGRRRQQYDQDQPLGDWFNYNEELAPGREIENEAGHVDVYAGANYSAGMSSSTDPYGNVTGRIGGRGSLEAGMDNHLNLPGGFGIDSSAAVGIEAYAEAGGTVGPDGYSVGARAGSGAYVENTTAITHESGASAGMTQSGWVGADAHATAHQHVTRNADGEVNGFSSGFSGGAFAGAEYKQEYEVNGPNGWFSVSGSASATAGAGASASGGYTISTDEISFNAGGKFAAELGLGGGGAISVSPNAIVESITPGDYNVDDAIDDVQGAWNSGTSAVGSAVSSLNPFD
ncbi:WXG100 family type VII secretion target [Brachybacterium sp. AOP43-C2-M15]|uniref:WXG100 family type VII secretion target n=1 Tax=Brachybacterium sp. AOP43-C2-M15 TaxID=3457661 RepID=UPI004033A49D